MGLNLAILISGRGSNMLNIVDAFQRKIIKSNVKVVISNNKNSLGITKAIKKNIPTKIINGNLTKLNFEKKLKIVLEKKKINLICLAGFMQILSKKFVNEWKNKIINIHPSLLPAFKGINAVEKALFYGVKVTGCTIHYVDEGIDTGKIIDQKIVKITKGDTVKTLTKKILKEEHFLYIKVLRNLERRK